MHAMENRDTGFMPNQLMLNCEVLMPLDIMMGINGATPPVCEPIEWVKAQAEFLLEMYSLLGNNLGVSLKCRKRDCDLRSIVKSYDRGDFAYNFHFTTKPGVKALFPVCRIHIQ